MTQRQHFVDRFPQAASRRDSAGCDYSLAGGRLPGEHSCLSLVWAVLDRASAGWRGFNMTRPGCGGRKISAVGSSNTGVAAPRQPAWTGHRARAGGAVA
jgi:hypothetical protein